MIPAVITGCKKSAAPKVVVRSPASSRAGMGGLITPTANNAVQPPPTAPAPTYYYDPAGKPDPFQPFDISKVTTNPALTPLQQFTLDQLTVKGIIWGVTNSQALVEDPTGKTYIVGVGTKIGKNNGVIIRIMNDKIVVLEQYTDVFTGKIKTHQVNMQLKKTQNI